jgi:hypothetical protein
LREGGLLDLFGADFLTAFLHRLSKAAIARRKRDQNEEKRVRTSRRTHHVVSPKQKERAGRVFGPLPG